MTETEWLDTQADPHVMIDHLATLKPEASRRKTRLCMVAYCRSIWHIMTDERCRHAVEVAERFADDPAAEADLKAAIKGLPTPRRDYGALHKTAPQDAARSCTSRKEKFLLASLVQVHALTAMAWQNCPHDPKTATESTTFQAGVIRDIFDNPFRPVAFDARWRTADVLGIARGIYEDRAFDRLPLLADALMDAGCDQEGILAHCRSEEPHVRGCWVVDLSLCKE
jgi:hypothetical protein